MYFEEYGQLEWLEPEDYYAGCWGYWGAAEGDDGLLWSIVINCEKTEFRYTEV